MAVEIYTHTGQNVADAVTQKFGDIGMVQLTNVMLLAWINDGMRKMTGEIPFLEALATTAEVAGQAQYDFAALFAAQRIQDISQVLVEGLPVDILPWQQFQPLASVNVLQSNLVEFQSYSGAFWGTVLNLYPASQNNVAAGISVYFHQYPLELTSLASTLTVPDRFYNGLVEYVLAQALVLNENYPAAQQMLGYHEASLQRQAEKNNQTPTDFYPSVTLDPFDNDAVY